MPWPGGGIHHSDEDDHCHFCISIILKTRKIGVLRSTILQFRQLSILFGTTQRKQLPSAGATGFLIPVHRMVG